MSVAYSGVAPATYGAAPVAYGAPVGAYGAGIGGFAGAGIGGFAGAGFGAGYGGFPIDPARVEGMKTVQQTRIGEQSQHIKGHLEATKDHQLHMIDQQAEQQIAVVMAQIRQRAEHESMRVRSSTQQQQWQVDHQHMAAGTHIEHRAMGLQASARQLDIMRSSYVPPVGGFGYGGF